MRTKIMIAVMIAVVVMFAGTAHSDILLSDNFNGETLGLNYTEFANWNVINGTVDLIGDPNFYDFIAGNGRYVDLDGSTSQAGVLTSKQSFILPVGETFGLSFNLAGSHRGQIETVDVTLAGIMLFQLTVPSEAPFTLWENTLPNTYGVTISGPLEFHNRGGDNIGALLDNVLLTGPAQQVPEPTTLLLLGLGMIGLGIVMRELF